MYESITYDALMSRMLGAVEDKYPDIDTREGSIIYDALAPAAAELAKMYISLDEILNETFADTASRQYLIRRAAERGLSPNDATKAVRKGTFNIAVSIGARFSLGSLNYAVTELIDDKSHSYRLECETAGACGNTESGRLTPIDYISGLESAVLSDIIIPGEDEEDTEAFRKRYISSLQEQAFGGNRADYIAKTSALDGVGGVKVYPVWNGGGTVKLVITDSGYGVPSDELISAVQQQADPGENGDGLGFAPIGHAVTVEAAQTETVDISFTLTYSSGYSRSDVQNSVEAAIDDYFLELAKSWAERENLIVRISRIETRILDIDGIIDIENVVLNGGTGNLTLGEKSIPKRGTISYE